MPHRVLKIRLLSLDYEIFIQSTFVIIGLQSCQQVGPKSLKIAIAGLAIESSTFSPARTEVDAFHSKEGAAIFDFYPFLSEDHPNRKRAQWFPTLKGHALPGGMVTRQAYDSLMGITLEKLKKICPTTVYFLIFMEP